MKNKMTQRLVFAVLTAGLAAVGSGAANATTPHADTAASACAPSRGAILYWIVEGKRYRAGAGARIAIHGHKVTFSGQLEQGPAFTGSGAFDGTLTCGA